MSILNVKNNNILENIDFVDVDSGEVVVSSKT